VPEVLTGCVVAQENPQVLLSQAATSLSFRFLVVMPFAGFSGITIGESPDILSGDLCKQACCGMIGAVKCF